jgi:hypothetical protein
MVPLCIMWCLWFECNERFFEGMQNRAEMLVGAGSGTGLDPDQV